MNREVANSGRIKCKCGRRVPNSFIDKLYHQMEYHPDQTIGTLFKLQTVAREFGSRVGKGFKR